MSGHLIGCVKDITDLGKSHKLALVAFADSADDRTHIGFAGYEGVMAWASCSRSRAAELIGDLVTAGYLHPHKRARPGRRAEYVVFPRGCCDAHRTPEPDADEVPIGLDVEHLVEFAKSAGFTIEPWQERILAARLGQQNGSEFSDTSSVDGSEIPDLSRDGSGNGSEISDASQQRVQNGSENLDPFTTTTTTPPSPRQRGATSQTGCHRHATAVDGCRCCGTTARQLAAQADRDRAEATRRAQADRVAAQAAAAKAARVSSTDPAVREQLQQTRAALAAGTGGTR